MKRMKRKRSQWTAEEIREIVAFAETHSLKETCDRFRIRHQPQFYYLKKRLEKLETQGVPEKRGPRPSPKPAAKPSGRPPKATPAALNISRPGPETVAKRRGRPPKAIPATPPSSKLLGLLEKVVSSLEELSAELQKMKASGKRSVRQKAK